MAKRELDLVPRVEAVRDERKIQPPVHFSLAEILQHYSESYAAIRNQFVVADQMLQEGNEEACKMILRSQVVLAEGLLDFYIHELSKFCMFQMFAGQWNKSDKYNQFMVPMAKVEEGLAATESREWFFELLNNRFGREVYLSLESMRDQLNMIGIGFTDAISLAFSEQPDSLEYGKRKIKDLFQRRNEIAHQNDRSHASAVQTEITKEYVEEYVKAVDAIVNGIHKVALQRVAESNT